MDAVGAGDVGTMQSEICLVRFSDFRKETEVENDPMLYSVASDAWDRFLRTGACPECESHMEQ